jgi:hypothetical protein
MYSLSRQQLILFNPALAREADDPGERRLSVVMLGVGSSLLCLTGIEKTICHWLQT